MKPTNVRSGPHQRYIINDTNLLDADPRGMDGPLISQQTNTEASPF